jgi:hypothetical protein
MPKWSRHLAQYLAIVTAAVIVVGPAQAQTKLKWAHVYEVAEPYHTNALWAADEIKKRTDGRYEIGVFPASQLGNENQINEGLGLGTVDIIYTGASFAGSIHKPLAITGATSTTGKPIETASSSATLQKATRTRRGTRPSPSCTTASVTSPPTRRSRSPKT